MSRQGDVAVIRLALDHVSPLRLIQMEARRHRAIFLTRIRLATRYDSNQCESVLCRAGSDSEGMFHMSLV